MGVCFYRHMEMLKIDALKQVNNYDKTILLTREAIAELNWWRRKFIYSSKPLIRSRPVAVIRTDASSFAWGANMGDTSTHGMWRNEEKEHHINVLELKAAILGVQSLCRNLKLCHLRIEVNNTTAVSYINNMGGTHSPACNEITRDLLLWCKSKGLWLSACHIAGKDNCEAGSQSRKHSIHTEWSLNQDEFGRPSIDIFDLVTTINLSGTCPCILIPVLRPLNALFPLLGRICLCIPPF